LSKLDRKPDWLKASFKATAELARVNAALRENNLNTVCNSANCPNRGECYGRGTATFMILGSICTRDCRFCNIRGGRPDPVDFEEPRRLAAAAAALGLKHVVVTSVTRDDLPDGGASQFAAVARELRALLPQSTIEFLTPDFAGSEEALQLVARDKPDIFNHNIETVPRLYPSVRPRARYKTSLDLLGSARERFGLVTKTGLMVGLGETPDELLDVFSDIANIGVSILTVGQYLSPTAAHLQTVRFYEPREFDDLAAHAKRLGIARVISAPLARSSYRAETVL